MKMLILMYAIWAAAAILAVVLWVVFERPLPVGALVMGMMELVPIIAYHIYLRMPVEREAPLSTTSRND